MRGVESPGEETAPRFMGEKEFSKNDFIKKINDEYKKAKLTKRNLETSVDILSRFESGRVDEMRIGGAKVEGKNLRRLLGLDSSNFTVSFTEDSIIFDTKGFGHGVGMSQTGADYMARTGATYEQIVAHYYTGTELSIIYTE